MTHNTEGDPEPVSLGNREGWIHTINITSLDSAGQENYDPASELNLPDGPQRGVSPVGQDNATVEYSWDHSANHLDVKTRSDNSDVANNDSPGEVRLLVLGGGA